MYIANNWTDYELLDTSDGERLERWGKYILIRPDPQVIWNGVRRHPLWSKADGHYVRSQSGGGHWEINKFPEKWNIDYNSLTFNIKPMGFKHTGVFPEQAANWDWFGDMIKNSGRKISVLNLFAYTGGATIAAASSGASVCHVDASKGIVALAKENAASSGLENAPIRYIVDDCIKFCQREIRRGNKYDAIIMDPPSYGRGPGGEMWKLESNIGDFIKLCAQLLSDDPLFFLLNSYTTGLSASTMGYLLRLHLSGGTVECDEIGLPVSMTGGFLPCGAAARWFKSK